MLRISNTKADFFTTSTSDMLVKKLGLKKSKKVLKTNNSKKLLRFKANKRDLKKGEPDKISSQRIPHSSPKAGANIVFQKKMKYASKRNTEKINNPLTFQENLGTLVKELKNLQELRKQSVHMKQIKEYWDNATVRVNVDASDIVKEFKNRLKVGSQSPLKEIHLSDRQY